MFCTRLRLSVTVRSISPRPSLPNCSALLTTTRYQLPMTLSLPSASIVYNGAVSLEFGYVNRLASAVGEHVA